MDALAISARNQCKACGQAVPFNAFVESMTCAACSQPVAFALDHWTTMLAKPFDLAWKLEPGETKSTTIIAGGTTRTIDYARTAAACGKCNTALPGEIAELAQRGWAICPACGHKLSVRVPPAALGHAGAALLVGEDLALVTTGSAPAPIVARAPTATLDCPHCHAPLSVDGAKRLVKCEYCSVDVYLPDDLWQRLHPVKQATRWYIVLPPRTDARLVATRGVRWGRIRTAVVDANKFVYCAGDHAVWCIGPDHEVRWMRADLDIPGDLGAALDEQSQRMIVWSSGKHSAVILAASDGATLGTLGGREPDGAKTHHFDLAACRRLVADRDGTFIALMERRLLRYDASGTGVATWPSHGLFGHEKLMSLFVQDKDGRRLDRFAEHISIDALGNHPIAFDRYADLSVGFDGRLYAYSGGWIVCFDRAGKRVYRIQLPNGIKGDELGADEQGCLYFRGERAGSPGERVVLRIASSGRHVDVIATDHRHGGVVGGETKLVVAADGSLLLLDGDARLRVLDRDGKLVWKSPASIEADAEEARVAARNA